MSDRQGQRSPPIQLPQELIDQVRPTFARFFRIEAAGGVALLLCTAVALILSNSPLGPALSGFWGTRLELRLGDLEFGRPLKAWVNDGLMTLFFFLVALELKRELVLGEMRQPRRAALPMAAALGGMVGPAAIFLALQWGSPSQRGWGIAMATDTAFVIACLALLGRRVPQSLRVFMLMLAIVDDVGAILVVAVGYSSRIDGQLLTLAALCVLLLRFMARIGVRPFAPYVLIGGATWLAVDASGLHATITGVILGLMTPARRWVSDTRLYGILRQVIAHPAGRDSARHTPDRKTLLLAELAARESLSPLERLEMALHPWVSFGVMPLFALANAGLQLSWEGATQAVSLAVLLAFVLGKPAGIVLFSWLALHAGWARRAPDLGWRVLVGGSFLAGIGFTMALLIADLALSGSALDSAKIGIFMASLCSASLGLLVLAWTPSPTVAAPD
ncbi:Na+/H+ antiporter NhaA [Roseateles sp. DB2]|uniref:Na+/H+ antiporter NhaA n=1 Tax=Roseateles sp. DB2 TaxID=3453717 RepID=UPI003EEE17E1